MPPKYSDGIWDLDIPTPLSQKWSSHLQPYPQVPLPFEDSLQFSNVDYMRSTKPAEARHKINKHFLPELPKAPTWSKGEKWKLGSHRGRGQDHEFITDLPCAPGIAWKIGHSKYSFDNEVTDAIRDLWHQADTYWIAVACQIYGDGSWWPWVKAQHLVFFRDVISRDGTKLDENGKKIPKHPRHDLYMRLNGQIRHIPKDISEWLHTGYISTIDGVKRPTKPMIRSNISQQLLVQHQFVNHFMLQVTADLYSIFLVLYILKDDGSFHEGVLGRGDPSRCNIALVLGSNRIYSPLLPFRKGKPNINIAIKIDWDTAADAEGRSRNNNSAKKNNPFFHPYRIDFDDVGVPKPLIPHTKIPIPTDSQLQEVAWLEITYDPIPEGASKPVSQLPPSLPASPTVFNFQIPEDLKPYLNGSLKRKREKYVDPDYTFMGGWCPKFGEWRKKELQHAADKLNVPYPSGPDYTTLDQSLVPALKKAFRAKRQAFWDKARLEWDRQQAALDRKWWQSQVAEARKRKSVLDGKTPRKKQKRDRGVVEEGGDGGIQFSLI